MKYRQLGNSGLSVSELALGSMLFGEESSRSTSEAEAVKMIHAYIDAGGNHIDTANVYASGRSEEIIGKTITGRTRHDLVLATKVRFGGDDAGSLGGGLGRRHIISHIEESLRRLKTDYIDLYYFHGWDPRTPIEESLRAMEDLVSEGKVRYIGVSNFKAWQVMKALGLSRTNSWVSFVAGQYQYSLVVRDIEDEFESLFKSEGIGCVPWGPLGGGFLSGKYNKGSQPSQGRIAVSDDQVEEAWERRSRDRNWRIIDMVQSVAERRNASMPQVALAWLLSRDWVRSVIIGARTMDQFNDNIQAAEIQLSEDDICMLDEVSMPEEKYPYRMMRTYGME